MAHYAQITVISAELIYCIMLWKFNFPRLKERSNDKLEINHKATWGLWLFYKQVESETTSRKTIQKIDFPEAKLGKTLKVT